LAGVFKANSIHIWLALILSSTSIGASIPAKTVDSPLAKTGNSLEFDLQIRHKKGKFRHVRLRMAKVSRKSGTSSKYQTTESKHGGSWSGDVRNLPPTPPKKKERPKRPDPPVIRKVYKKTVVRKGS
jgi:hypothetical protein